MMITGDPRLLLRAALPPPLASYSTNSVPRLRPLRIFVIVQTPSIPSLYTVVLVLTKAMLQPTTGTLAAGAGIATLRM
jgi:hypothetical protein